jgi:site-specific recombinase XerD
MRRSEQFGLTWDFVNFEKRILTIARSKHGEIRQVFLNDMALAALRVVWRFSVGSGGVFSKGCTSEETPGAREWLEGCVKAAKISSFTRHCLRHTFASNLVMQGVDIRTVEKLMGHKTIRMTLRSAHLAPQHQLAAVQRLCDTKAESAKEEAAQKTPTSTEPSEADATTVASVQ